MGKNNKELSTEVKETLPAVPEKFDEVFTVEENMAGVERKFPVIKIVHPVQLFQMPDESTPKEFKGIILDSNRINAWWEKSFDETGGGTPPDCFSLDGIECNQNSSMPQSETCGTNRIPECNMNKFASEIKKGGEKGRGKACKNMRRVHIIIEGKALPHRMTLPPSSLKSMDDYIDKLSQHGLQYQRLFTIFKLKEDKNKDGVKYSVIKPERGELISDSALLEYLMELYTTMKSDMREQKIKFKEYKETVE